MIIGNLVFDGPYQLQNWDAPEQAGVYSILHNNGSNSYTVDYVGESANLNERGFPWSHHRAECWIMKAGSKSNVYVATYFMSGSSQQDRMVVERDLIYQFNPPCNG